MNANGFTKHSGGRPSFGLAALVAAAALATAGGVSASESDPTGVWLDSAGRGAVEISPCGPGGSGGTLCGRVVWVKSASHQKRCGEQILGNLEAGGDGTWGSGWIYSPDRGRKFDVEIKRIGPDKLRVMGYAGVRMFSETHVWKRAAPDLARCGGEQTAQATPRDATAKAAAKADAVAAPLPADVPPIASAEVAAASAAPSTSVAASAGPAPVSTPASAAGRSTDSPAAAKGRADAKAAKTAEKRAPRDDGAGEKSPAGKYFKRYADGTCKVDTPWIQMRFDCRRP